MHNNEKTRILTRVALFAAIFAVFAQIYVPLPFSPVPITLQTLGIMLCAVTLKPRETLYAVGLYTLMGVIGLPVFAGFTGGAARLAGPTGGFIIGWFPAAWLMSCIVHMENINGKEGLKRFASPFAGIIVFTVVLYFFGLIWFIIAMKTSAYQAFLTCMLPFVPGDAVKCAVVILSYPVLIQFPHTHFHIR